MATLREPFALDRSLNTTEGTPRNIADVLAEELSRITGRNASQVEYDNTESGLTADNVQDALDEIVEDIPTVPSVDIQTAVDEFETYNGGLLSSLKVSLSPNQDLHGYDEPWVGGSRKNKAILEQGTLDLSDGSENSSTTRVRTNFISVQVGQTYIASSENNGWSIRNGCTYDASKNFISNGVYPDPSDGTITIPSGVSYVRFIYSHSDTSETCTPDDYWYQFELGSTATAYESYENICPISGHTQVDVDVSDGQATQEQVTVNLGGTYYSGTLDVVTGVLFPDTAGKDMTTITDWNVNIANQRIYKILSDIKPTSGSTIIPNIISNSFKAISINDIYAYVQGVAVSTGSALQFHIKGLTDRNDVTLAEVNQWFVDNPTLVVYELANPAPIQLSPTMVKALVGENHLSAPLEGQEITESKYKQMFTFDDVIAYIQSL